MHYHRKKVPSHHKYYTKNYWSYFCTLIVCNNGTSINLEIHCLKKKIQIKRRGWIWNYLAFGFTCQKLPKLNTFPSPVSAAGTFLSSSVLSWKTEGSFNCGSIFPFKISSLLSSSSLSFPLLNPSLTISPKLPKGFLTVSVNLLPTFTSPYLHTSVTTSMNPKIQCVVLFCFTIFFSDEPSSSSTLFLSSSLLTLCLFLCLPGSPLYCKFSVIEDDSDGESFWRRSSIASEFLATEAAAALAASAADKAACVAASTILLSSFLTGFLSLLPPWIVAPVWISPDLPFLSFLSILREWTCRKDKDASKWLTHYQCTMVWIYQLLTHKNQDLEIIKNIVLPMSCPQSHSWILG